MDGQLKKQTMIYRFVVARDRLASTFFTAAEIDAYQKTDSRAYLLGCGTFFEFKLADLDMT